MKLYFIDLFCGAGGTTTGLHNARVSGANVADVIACINHDEKAIKSHYLNHPQTKHFTEDIRTIDISPIIKMVIELRLKEPDAIICLWASLECTNFSKAKGGQPRNADSRTLAEHLYRYIQGINPEYIFIENVEEFMCWGPLDKKGKPISRRAGSDYLKWITHVKSFGYNYDYKILNSADYGAYTSRKRYFGLFALPHMAIKFPEATHSKKAVSDQFGSLQKWKPVKEVLDFADEGNSIFERKKSLSEKTLARIYAGLIKYVAGGKDAFMLKYNSTSQKGVHVPPSVDDPCPTVACQNRLGVCFISKYYSGAPDSKNISVDGPAGTITCMDHHSLVQPKFITKYYSAGGQLGSIEEPAGTLSTKDRMAIVNPCYLVNYHHSSKVNSIDEPNPTITCKDKFAVVQPKYWIDKQYSGSDNHQSVNQPAGSILGNDKHCLVRCEHFIDKQFSQGSRNQSVDVPSGTLTTVPKMNLVTAKWIMNTNFNNVGSSIDEPNPTITANRKHHYIVNPSWGGNNGDINAPCCTIVARQDKAPLYLVSTDKGEVALAVYECDSEIMIKIKEFMVIYGIVDIKMRMLKIPELLKIQGFPDKYILIGNQADQKKFIGNAVVPLIPEKWIEAIYSELVQIKNAA